MDPFLIGIVLGLIAGAIPGPFSALVVATSLEADFWAGLRVAVVPIASEIVVLTVSALVIAQMPEGVLRWMGAGGGALILYLAWRTWRRADEDPQDSMPGKGARRSLEAALLALVSPTPWVFWMLVGAPLIVGFWREGWGEAVTFAGAFIGTLVLVRAGVAGLAAHGHRRLRSTWRRRAMKGTSLFLVIAALVLGWQSWVGNFQRLVTDPETIRLPVTDSVSDSP